MNFGSKFFNRFCWSRNNQQVTDFDKSLWLGIGEVLVQASYTHHRNVMQFANPGFVQSTCCGKKLAPEVWQLQSRHQIRLSQSFFLKSNGQRLTVERRSGLAIQVTAKTGTLIYRG